MTDEEELIEALIRCCELSEKIQEKKAVIEAKKIIDENRTPKSD